MQSELEEVVAFLRAPHKFTTLQRCSGVLLYAPPGTGKTMLARAIAGKFSCFSFTISCIH